MTFVAVKVGALSNPGVEIGIESISKPLPSPCKAAPSMITSWQIGFSTMTGAIGFCMALSHFA